MRLFLWRRPVLWLNFALLFALSFLFFLFSFNKTLRFLLRAQRVKKGDDGLQFKYKLNDNRGKEVQIVELLLPEASAPLQERISIGAKSSSSPRGQSILLMWDLEFSDKNLRGCPEWNCRITNNHSLFDQARAVFFASANVGIHQRPGQYFVHYSQESPANMPSNAPGHFFNMSFGFRMDGNSAASPYGFAARLAPESRPGPDYLDGLLDGVIRGKSKPVAWFVSHCGTKSGRELIAREMQKHIQVDIYGGCGPLKCQKGAKCKEMLDTDYYFYFAAENSICLDYLTEKIWDQGLDSFSVPIVLRRSLVQHLLPPKSFIAVDDFDTISQLTDHLHRLMVDARQYLGYFEWRMEFVAIKLNGDTDPAGEKLFGVCQVCRLTQMEPRPEVSLPGPMQEWWDGSCEKTGQIIAELAGHPLHL